MSKQLDSKQFSFASIIIIIIMGAARTDPPVPILLLISIVCAPGGLPVYTLYQLTALVYWVCCFSNLYSSMRRGSQENITYVFVLTSQAVSHMSGSSILESFHDE